ncbi:unnamed protein product [Ambrosiozyma monospora]|uniref:Unnamed protein product n=1 Tax=Ambrosiozyma monospora TaxID=43982 RepID=A0A9W6Z2W2_AMBMO|nr:unnamed protein product [Ambrosiozyma monospora]
MVTLSSIVSLRLLSFCSSEDPGVNYNFYVNQTVSNPAVVASEYRRNPTPSSSPYASLSTKFWSLFSSSPKRDEKLLPATYRFPTLTFLPENRVQELNQISIALKGRVFDPSILLTKLCEANPTVNHPLTYALEQRINHNLIHNITSFKCFFLAFNTEKDELLSKINQNLNKLNQIPPASQANDCKRTLEYIADECPYLSFADMDMLLPWLTNYGTFRNVSLKSSFLDKIHKYTDLQEFAAANINNTDEFFSSSFIHQSSKKANSERESLQSINQANQDQIEHIHNNKILVTDISSSPTMDSVPHVSADFTNLPQMSFDALIDTGSSSCLIGEEIVETINVPPINPITTDFPLEPPPRRPSDYISQLAS